MQENYLNLPDEIWLRHIWNYLLPRDLKALANVDKSRQKLVRTGILISPNQDYEKIKTSYLAFAIANLDFVLENKVVYLDALEKALKVGYLNHWQKISIYALLKVLREDQVLYRTYYKNLFFTMSSLFADIEFITWVETLISTQLKNQLFSLELFDTFSTLLFDQKRALQSKKFLASCCKCVASPLVIKTFLSLVDKALVIFNNSELPWEARKGAADILTILTSEMPQEKQDKICDSLLNGGLLESNSCVRRLALQALSYFTAIGLMDEKAEAILIDKISQAYTMPSGNPELILLVGQLAGQRTLNLPNVIDELIKIAKMKFEDPDVLYVVYRIFNDFLLQMSDAQLWEVVSCFLTKMQATIPEKEPTVELVYTMLQKIATKAKKAQIKTIIDRLLTIEPVDLPYHITLLQILSFFSASLPAETLWQLMSTVADYKQIINSLNILVTAQLINSLELLANRIFITLIDNASVEQLPLVWDFLENFTSGNFLASTMATQAFIRLATRMPAVLDIPVILKYLQNCMEKSTSVICWGAIQAFCAILPHLEAKDAAPFISPLFTCTKDKDLKICSAAIRALVQLAERFSQILSSQKLISVLLNYLDAQASEILFIGSIRGLVQFIPELDLENTKRIIDALFSKISKMTIADRYVYPEVLKASLKFSSFLTKQKREQLITSLIGKLNSLEGKNLQATLNALLHFSADLSDDQNQISQLKSTLTLDNSFKLPASVIFEQKTKHIISFWEKLYMYQLERELKPVILEVESQDVSYLPLFSECESSLPLEGVADKKGIKMTLF